MSSNSNSTHRLFKRLTKACLSLWLIALLSLTILPLGTASATVTGVKPYITILCKFKDITSEPRPTAFYRSLLAGGAIPSIPHYFREVSDGKIDLTGSQVGGWYTLPRNRAQYIVDVQEETFDLPLLAQDCTNTINASVNFTAYHGINLVFNGEIDGGTSSGYSTFDIVLDGKRYWPVTFISRDASLNHSLFAHEMGHTLGMLHVKDSLGNNYTNVWDVMGQNYSRLDDFYGYVAQHPTVYNKYIAGWISEGRVRDFTTTQPGNYNVSVQQHTDPRNDSTPLMIRVQYNASNYYIIEARIRSGYDEGLPSRGVIIHDRAKIGSGYKLVDADNDANTADPEAYLVAGETIELPIPGKTSKIRVTLNSNDSLNFYLTLNVPNAPY